MHRTFCTIRWALTHASCHSTGGKWWFLRCVGCGGQSASGMVFSCSRMRETMTGIMPTGFYTQNSWLKRSWQLTTNNEVPFSQNLLTLSKVTKLTETSVQVRGARLHWWVRRPWLEHQKMGTWNNFIRHNTTSGLHCNRHQTKPEKKVTLLCENKLRFCVKTKAKVVETKTRPKVFHDHQLATKVIGNAHENSRLVPRPMSTGYWQGEKRSSLLLRTLPIKPRTINNVLTRNKSIQKKGKSQAKQIEITVTQCTRNSHATSSAFDSLNQDTTPVRSIRHSCVSCLCLSRIWSIKNSGVLRLCSQIIQKSAPQASTAAVLPWFDAPRNSLRTQTQRWTMNTQIRQSELFAKLADQYEKADTFLYITKWLLTSNREKIVHSSTPFLCSHTKSRGERDKLLRTIKMFCTRKNQMAGERVCMEGK